MKLKDSEMLNTYFLWKMFHLKLQASEQIEFSNNLLLCTFENSYFVREPPRSVENLHSSFFTVDLLL